MALFFYFSLYSQNGTYVNKFPVEWNQTMAEDLKRFNELNQNLTVNCEFNEVNIMHYKKWDIVKKKVCVWQLY